MRQKRNLRSKYNIHSKEEEQKNLNHCHQMLFLGYKYANIAFAAMAVPRTPLGELKCSPDLLVTI